jgi:heparan-alpha-glucosaminide N-acetyltransferase
MKSSASSPAAQTPEASSRRPPAVADFVPGYAPTAADEVPITAESPRSERVVSIDALRGFVMFMMIFVNDLAGVPNRIVPGWMKHFRGKDGMTFVDLVFPAFLFIVGMSIPFALGARLKKGEALWKTGLHILVRTASLLLIGIMMVNGESRRIRLRGWNLQGGVFATELWVTLMFLSAILAFCAIVPPAKVSAGRKRKFSILTTCLRSLGFAGLIYLAFAYVNKNGDRIITLSPFSINTEWYGILGLIGWAYLVGALAFLVFRTNRTALLGCTVLLMCFFPADKKGAFDQFWLGNYVGIGDALGSQAAITVAGVLLASILLAPEAATHWLRTRFTLLYIAGFSAAAWLVRGLYGINKNSATPSWCLWSCAATSALWLLFYHFGDTRAGGLGAKISRPFYLAGQNVLLAYLISEMIPGLLKLIRLDDWYDALAEPNLAHAIARSASCAAGVLAVSVGLNKAGFRLRL